MNILKANVGIANGCITVNNLSSDVKDYVKDTALKVKKDIEKQLKRNLWKSKERWRRK